MVTRLSFLERSKAFWAYRWWAICCEGLSVR